MEESEIGCELTLGKTKRGGGLERGFRAHVEPMSVGLLAVVRPTRVGRTFGGAPQLQRLKVSQREAWLAKESKNGKNSDLPDGPFVISRADSDSPPGPSSLSAAAELSKPCTSMSTSVELSE